MEILLGRNDVDPDSLDNVGQTPLHYAALNGHGEVVEILLGRDDVNPNASDGGDQTPLCGAAFNGHESATQTERRHHRQAR